MAKDRETIRSELRDELRVDPNGKVWSDSVLNTAIHEGEIEVARRTRPTELETSDTFSSVIGDRSYDLATNLSSTYLSLISIIYDVQATANITAATIAFVDSNPDTITDSGNAFVTAGFTSGMKLQIVNSTSNNDTTYEVDTVVAGTLTLVSGDAVVVESAGATLSIVGNTEPDHTIELEMAQDIRDIEGSSFNNTLGYPSKYAIFQNQLYFNALPKEVDTVQVRYLKIPDLMSSDATNSDIPDELIPLVKLWAEYLAWNQLPGEEVSAQNALNRFEREASRKNTLRNLNTLTVSKYRSSNWRK